MGIQFYGIDERRMAKGPRGSEHPAIVGDAVGRQEGVWMLSTTGTNGRALLGLLGLGSDRDHGRITIAEARRAWIYATNTFERRVGCFTRALRTCNDAGRARAIIMGVDESYFERRLAAWIELVVNLEAAGATALVWA